MTDASINPFQDWIQSIRDVVTRARIRTRLNRLRLGNFGDCKSIGHGIFELRINSGPGYRIYFGQLQSTVVLLLCGGDKSNQRKDIRQAKEFWQDFKRRMP